MMDRTRRRIVRLSLLVVGFWNLAAGLLLAAGEKQLRVGFHLDTSRFDKEFSEKDVKLATQVLFQKLLGQSGEFDATFHPYRNKSEFVKAINAGELDYVEMGPLLWLPSSAKSQTLWFWI